LVTGARQANGSIFLIMHLISTALVVVTLVIAWRWERIGTILFAALGLGCFIMTRGWFDWATYLLISDPLRAAGFPPLSPKGLWIISSQKTWAWHPRAKPRYWQSHHSGCL
jgi:hypothetical protein